MVKSSKQRALEKLAFRYWKKNPKRTKEENWRLAEALLKKLELRYGKN